ncbi:MAG: PAC2 family protein [Nitriliruptorales bacterium]
MEILRLHGPLDEVLSDPVIVVCLDGWTDAGRAGTIAGETLQEQWHGRPIADFGPDVLYDYRDRRPLLTIDRGVLGDPVWPELTVSQNTTPNGRDVILVQGAEPDFSWQQICADLVELAEVSGARRYIGLGAVPGPTPHTRSTRLVVTASDEDVLQRYGRPHEHLTVPASCQVVLETAFRDAGLQTLGLWARIPHYVAGEYPAGAHALLSHLASELGEDIDLSEIVADTERHRRRLDEAAQSSTEIVAHIHQLEEVYDQDLADESGFGPIPSGDEIAAELERFLRGQ